MPVASTVFRCLNCQGEVEAEHAICPICHHTGRTEERIARETATANGRHGATTGKEFIEKLVLLLLLLFLSLGMLIASIGSGMAMRLEQELAFDWFDDGDRPARVMPAEVKMRADRLRVLQRDGAVECAICLETIKVGETTGELKCRHLYHHQCVATWLRKKNTCPLCRAKQ